MKKVSLISMVILMIFAVASSCFAFPAVGKYESEKILLYEDYTGKRYGALYTFEIQQSEQYFGKLYLSAKGAWIGNWTAPLSIAKTSNGRYSLKVISDNRSYWVEIEENQDSSITLYGLSDEQPIKNLKATVYKVN